MSRQTTVTITDVAREAGVALSSVSNAFQPSDKGAPETLRRIREAADRLGYAPNQSARMLAGGKTACLGSSFPISITASPADRQRLRTPRRASTDTACSSPPRRRTGISHIASPRLLYWHADGGHPHAAARQHGLAAPCTRLASPSHSSISSVTSGSLRRCGQLRPRRTPRTPRLQRPAVPDASQSSANPR